MEFLITFESTTAAFRAEQAVRKDLPRIIPELVSVPFKLAATCYGIGMKFIGTKNDVSDIFHLCSEKTIAIKRIWQKVEEDYVAFNPKAGDEK